DGFAILKVGPWLTFALREALYGLDAVADVLSGHPPRGRLLATMERAMQEAPEHWQGHYAGDPSALWAQRHFSLSDRIRYYWPSPEARAAVDDLMQRLGKRQIPGPLLRQYLPGRTAMAEPCDAHTALILAVQDVLAMYAHATEPGESAR
ncbi:MAG: class II D-tagatose-bisphosphate aldolase, non-catalytic subunit, partial [Pseudomonadota bacterium]